MKYESISPQSVVRPSSIDCPWCILPSVVCPLSIFLSVIHESVGRSSFNRSSVVHFYVCHLSVIHASVGHPSSIPPFARRPSTVRPSVVQPSICSPGQLVCGVRSHTVRWIILKFITVVVVYRTRGTGSMTDGRVEDPLVLTPVTPAAGRH